jgi:hypothetical protein
MYRYLVEVLQSGQSRAYADTTRHVRLTIDTFFAWLGDPKDERSHWKPNDSWKDEEIRALLKLLKCGFTDAVPENWASTRLDWIKKTAPGVWEFHTTSAYTD